MSIHVVKCVHNGRIEYHLRYPGLSHEHAQAIADLINSGKLDTSPPAAARVPADEPVAWREHVEQRMRQWRQSFVNRSGDRLALDDFMDSASLNDLIDYVCDEWATPPAAARVPDGWVPLTIEWDPGYPEEVAFGPQRMMDRLKKWLDAHFAAKQAAAARVPLSPAQMHADELVAAAKVLCDDYTTGDMGSLKHYVRPFVVTLAKIEAASQEGGAA